MPNNQTFDDIRRRVVENDDVLSLPMIELRTAYGAERLGAQVRAGISNELAGHGLAHVPPDELPDSQYTVVRIYRRGSGMAELIEAAMQPGEGNDDILRRLVKGGDSELLRKIRALVCE